MKNDKQLKKFTRFFYVSQFTDVPDSWENVINFLKASKLFQSMNGDKNVWKDKNETSFYSSQFLCEERQSICINKNGFTKNVNNFYLVVISLKSAFRRKVAVWQSAF